MQEILIEHVELILFFSGIACVANWIAWSRGFYAFPLPKLERNPLTLKQVAAGFAIYLGFALFFAPLLGKVLLSVKLFPQTLDRPSALVLGWVQLITMLLILLSLFCFCKSQDARMVQRIWKDRSSEKSSSILFDFGLGAVTWCMGFPLVAVIGQLSDFILYLLFGLENYEQVAVRYLKMTLSSPSLLVGALFTILIAAPLVEELLFRGFLQTWLKGILGVKAAILLSAFCFAIFHLSPSQGLGNISLALSLFVFACFLGFIYERQRSLFASIGLHVSFNAISTARVLFMPEL